MTDIELLQILESPRGNLEKAIAIRAALQSAAPSAFNIKPQVQRKPRQARTPKPVASTPTTNGLDDDEATS